MAVRTQDGEWVVPPREAVWIPGGVWHGMKMLSDVATRSVYFDTEIARAFPEHCQVVAVSPLLRQLLISAAELPADYEPGSRAWKLMALIVEELSLAAVLPLGLPIPVLPHLAALCRDFAEAPNLRQRTDDWCSELGMSRRAFTRLFRRETGMSLGAWQRRACIQMALTRLLNGETVTAVAFDFGYSSSSAFTAMFTQIVRTPPSEFLRRSRQAAD